MHHRDATHKKESNMHGETKHHHEGKITRSWQHIVGAVATAMIIALIFGMIDVSKTVAQLEQKMEVDDRREIKDEATDKQIQANQVKFQVEIAEMKVNQQNMAQDIEQVIEQNEKSQEQNTEMLNILRSMNR